MAVRDRTRDFTQDTLYTIRAELRGSSDEYKEFSRFWSAYGGCFEQANPLEDFKQVDAYMTDVRTFMHYTAPKALDTIEENVRMLDAAYAAKCRETAEGLAQYGNKLDALTAAIGDPDFTIRLARNKTTFGMSITDVPRTGNPAVDFWIFIGWLLLLFGVAILAWLGITSAPSGTDTAEVEPMPLPNALSQEAIVLAVGNLNDNDKSHILQDKHNWDKLVPDPKEPNNWDKIASIITTVLTYGSIEYWSEADEVFVATFEIAGYIVQVTFKIIDGIIRIGSAWIK